MNVARDAERPVHLGAYVRVLRKHRWTATGIFLGTVFTVAIWTFTQTPIYQATATVLIEPEAPKVMNIQEVTPMGGPSQDYYLTQNEIMKSRAVVEKVIASLKLKERIRGLAAARDPYLATLSSIRVEPKRLTRLVFVHFENRDPGLAAEVATAIATTYTKYNVELKLRGAREALTWLNEEMAQLKGKVQDSSVALQNYRVKAGILGIEEQRKITAQKIMDFNRAYLEAQAQRLSIEAKMRELNRIAAVKGGAQTIFTVADSSLLQKLKAEASDLEVQKSKLLKTYKDKHPEILKVDAQIQQVRDKIDSEMQTMLRAVQTEYRVARAREEVLLGNVNQLRSEGQDLNEKEIEYQTLARDSDSNQQLYDAVLKRLKETGITGGLETNNVRVIEEARVPLAPVRPNKSLYLIVSVIIGLVAGIGAAFAIEYFDTTLKSPEDVEQHLGLPVIAIVPLFPRKA